MNKSASIGPINKSCFFSTHAVSCRNYQPQRPYLCRYSHYFLFNSKLFVYFFALVLICATVVFPSFSARCYGEVVFAARGNLARDEIKDNSALISIPAVLNGKPSFKSNSLFNFSNQENIYNISAHDGLLLGACQ